MVEQVEGWGGAAAVVAVAKSCAIGREVALLRRVDQYQPDGELEGAVE